MKPKVLDQKPEGGKKFGKEEMKPKGAVEKQGFEKKQSSKLKKPSVAGKKNLLKGNKSGDGTGTKGTKLKPKAAPAKMASVKNKGAGIDAPDGKMVALRNKIRAQKMKNKKQKKVEPPPPAKTPPPALGKKKKNKFKDKKLLKQRSGGGEDNQNDVNSAIVGQTLGKISGNLTGVIKDKKTSKGLMINYGRLQKGIMKQMKSIDKEEGIIAKDTAKTQKGINDLKKGGKGGGNIFMSLLGGLSSFMFFIIGGLIIISLIRIALRNWVNTYMPPTDGSTMTIFGFQIPGWDTIKAFGLAIWNWVTVGFPIMWEKLKMFFGNIYRFLFGKKGVLRNGAQAMSTLKRIVHAYIIGVAKKGYGWFFKILGWALSFIPGWGTALSFICKLLPAIITFIWTQIMLAWHKKGAAEEEQFQQYLAAQQLSGEKGFKKLKKDLLKDSAKIKPFRGQMANIPGLQAAKNANGKGYEKHNGAIMTKVPNRKVNKTFKAAQAIQEKQYEDSEDQRKEEYEKKARTSKTGVIGKLVRSAKAHEAESNNFSWSDDYNKVKSIQDKVGQEVVAESLKLEIDKLDKWIEALKGNKRFQNVKGPLYDVEKGWNPGYRVYAKDLMSPIPLTPFEEIHAKPDVPFGEPADAERESKGFKPFTWYQKGAKISVHPINYEMARAMGIRKIYEWTIKELLDPHWYSRGGIDIEDFQKNTLPDAMNWWEGWNYATVDHEFEELDTDTYLFQSKFDKFYNMLKEGKIDGKNNSLQTALDQTGDGFWENFWEGTKTTLYYASGIGLIADAGEAIGKWAAKKAENVERAFSYNKNSHTDEDSNFMVNAVTGLAGIISDGARLLSWRNEKAEGIDYGDVRDFMIDEGVINMFSSGTIMAPIKKAIPLIDEMIDELGFPKAPDVPDHTYMHDLMWGFFNHVGFTGYDWNVAKQNDAILAGFAQIFLEYFAHKVMPEWNIAEQKLSDALSSGGIFGGDERENNIMYAELHTLHKLFKPGPIYDFMKEYLRFPLMETNVIDYENASGVRELITLDMYRNQHGFWNRKQKEEVNAAWHKSVVEEGVGED